MAENGVDVEYWKVRTKILNEQRKKQMDKQDNKSLQFE